ncbi:MAG: type I-E CRISPR-associated protein Cas5/CasD [Syntrophobacterales bacterium CG_4_8_14_3_um_filter_49_14]|nr:MAG: type I-E CRISPR-associated protein Cas5/CasD [Syntrophobacterales bacterium CG_4_8_14_3_um_filter_49_14]
MPTLLLRLVGPMQSWGTTSRFDQRDTGKEPSKSGVVGLLAAALGIDREKWTDLEPLTHLSMGVRHDRSGVPKRDYQTAGCATTDTVIKADGTPSKDGVVSHRFYLADAAFLVALEGDDRELLNKAHNKLKDPTWPLALGRKSYLPAEPIWIKEGIQEAPLLDTLKSYPWIGTLRRWEEKPPEQLLVSLDSEDGSGVLKMDQPLSSFAERRFGARFVRSEWIPCPQEVDHVLE